jgi:hypothetical protein
MKTKVLFENVNKPPYRPKPGDYFTYQHQIDAGEPEVYFCLDACFNKREDGQITSVDLERGFPNSISRYDAPSEVKLELFDFNINDGLIFKIAKDQS